MSEHNEILGQSESNRVTRLETQFEGIGPLLIRVEQKVGTIENTVNEMKANRGKVQWSLIVSIVALSAGAFMAEQSRYSEMSLRLAIINTTLSVTAANLNSITEHGTPNADKRLTILEQQIDRLTSKR